MRAPTIIIMSMTALLLVQMLGPLGTGHPTGVPTTEDPIDMARMQTFEQGFFVENKGQWNDGLLFIAKTGFGRVGVGPDCIYYNVLDRSAVDIPDPKSKGLKDLLMEGSGQEMVDGAVVKVTFDGGSKVAPEGTSIIADNFNFFLGNDPSGWATGVRSYQRIEYNDLWNGIDLVLTLKDGGLKYDLVLHPGSEPSDISFLVEGHSGLMAEGTELTIRTPIGMDITDSGLCANYIDGQKEGIGASFILQGQDRYGISLDSFDSSRPVIVDPLVFSTYYGGTDEDDAYDIDRDPSGNLYVAGYTYSWDFPITKSAYQTSNNGYSDIFVFKMSSDGTTISYSTYIGGSDYDFSQAIKVDGAGNAYVTGGSYSLDFPTTSGAFNETHWNTIDYMDAIVFKLDPKGSSLIFSTYVAGEDMDAGLDIGIDSVGSSFVVGISASTEFPTTSGAYDEDHNGDIDIILFMLSYTGSYLKYSTYIGGDDTDIGYSLDYVSQDAIYLTGSTYSYDFPVTGNVRLNGMTDVVALRMDLGNSTLIYSTLIGGDDEEEGYGIDVDDLGNAYITGYTWGGSRSMFPTTTGAFDTTFNGFIDTFVLKLDRKGSSLLYSTYIGGTEEEEGRSIILDEDSNSYVCGFTASSDHPISPGADYPSFQGGYLDAVVCKLDNTGSSLLYSTYLGGSSDETAYSIILDPAKKAIVTGSTDSKNYPTTTGVVQTTLMGAYDCFVTKLNFVSRPTEPRSPKAIGGAGYVLLNWTVPASDGGAPILHYTIYKGLTDSSLTSYLKTTNIVLNDTKVNSGTIYYYSVSANNSIGESPQTTVVSAMPIGRPSVPRSFTIIAGQTYIDLDWDTPLQTGGSPLAGYWVYRGTSPGSLVKLMEVSPANTYYRDESVEQGITYFYRLTALNIVGESIPTETLNASMPDVPSPPVDLSVTWGDSYVHLSWVEPLDNGGLLLNGFKVYRSNSSTPFKLLMSLTSSALTYNDTTVTNGVTYTYNVTAFNSLGESVPAVVSSTPLGTPGKPKVLPPGWGDGYVHLYWEAPEVDGGTPVLGYHIYQIDDTSQLQLVGEVGPDVRDHNMTGLVNGRIYYCYVTAFNIMGDSKKSEMMTGIPIGLPDPPVDLKAVPGDGYVQLSWSKPVKDGGSAIMRYFVLRGTDQTSWEEFNEVVNISSTSYNDTKVENGITYKYVVRAMTSIGFSGPSSVVNAIPLGVPSAPRNFTLKGGNKLVEVSWLPPEKNGGTPITGYKVLRGEVESSLDVIQAIGPGSLSFEDTNVTNGKVYYYRLIAKNIMGDSLPTQTISIRPLGTPSAPRNVRTEASGSYIKVLWEPPEDTGGASITGYEIYRSDDGGEMKLVGSVGPGINTYLDKDVKPGVKYVYTVKATNSVGNSVASSTASMELEKEGGGGGGLGWLLWLVLALLAMAAITGLVLFLVLRKRKAPEQAPPPIVDQGMDMYQFPPGTQQLPVPPAPPQQQLYGAYNEQPLMQVTPPAPVPELGPAQMGDQPASGPLDTYSGEQPPTEVQTSMEAPAPIAPQPEVQPPVEAPPQHTQ
ncbi:MAG: fibronectin type III domain-containing protein [Candidatus Thermoplasmatota archaeon]|nr:fibronectin type III domain-containing protein [Candidatus Thermoplasmatota archaeon]